LILDQSSSPSSSEEFELELLLEFELELLLEFELELLLEFELELLLEFELELLLEFELLFELELLSEFELLLELEPVSEAAQLSPKILQSLVQPLSSAAAGKAKNDVAMKATLAAFVMVFMRCFLF
jgi:hypothetical protein